MQQVNAGGAAYVETAAKVWSADQAYQPGGWGYVGATSGISTTTHVISGTTTAPLYQTQRAGMTGYAFTVPNGQYTALPLFFLQRFCYNICDPLSSTRAGRRTAFCSSAARRLYGRHVCGFWMA